ncbi:MAG: type VI secretion system-associated FHA domain protein TagH [Ancalomicrobiaceae bacterium]|nr:type VI secretion system-associated FHA domain protein TagH [Ancalomicrobiaceae bacterium]
MALHLVVTDGRDLLNGAADAVVVGPDRPFVIGRDERCDWALPDSVRQISGRHCEIDFADGRYRVRDLSTNGTFLDGAEERVDGTPALSVGTRLRVGPYVVTVSKISADTAPPRTAPPAQAEAAKGVPGAPRPPMRRNADPAAAIMAARAHLAEAVPKSVAGDDPGAETYLTKIRAAPVRAPMAPSLPTRPNEPTPAPAGEQAAAAQREPTLPPPSERPTEAPFAAAPASHPLPPSDPWATPDLDQPASPEAGRLEISFDMPAVRPSFHAPATAPAPAGAATPVPTAPECAAAPAPDPSALVRRAAAGLGLDPAQLADIDPGDLVERLAALARLSAASLKAQLDEKTAKTRRLKPRLRLAGRPVDANPLKVHTIEQALLQMLKADAASPAAAAKVFERSLQEIARFRVKLDTAVEAAVAQMAADLAPAAIEAHCADFAAPDRLAETAWELYRILWHELDADWQAGFRQAFDFHVAEAFADEV